MIPSHLLKGLGLGVVLAGVSTGAAMAAVATTDVNVRSGPGTNYPVISGLAEGQHAAVVRESGGWCFVNKVGTDGWVNCAYLSGGSYRPDVYVPRVYEPPPVYFNFDYGPRFPYHRMHHFSGMGMHRFPHHRGMGPGMWDMWPHHGHHRHP